MNCNIIKDLIPSYVDGICSEETVELVEDHIQHCKVCCEYVNAMQQQSVYVQSVPEKVEKAIKPFKKINRKRYIQVVSAIAITFMLTVIGGWVIQDVGAVNQIFFPKAMATAVITDDQEKWQSINFSTDLINYQDYLLYDSLFWKKEIVNDANNESDVLLRVKNEKGVVIIDDIQLSPGTSIKLDNLKKGEKYFFEIKAPQGRFTINAV